mmetsp:Transcript_96516/g.311685  ORF Transcript_96516/g.311685 Transcript_96516/m.311685 type:complete len:207 (-) Transcript_96516:186-806(-)
MRPLAPKLPRVRSALGREGYPLGCEVLERLLVRVGLAGLLLLLPVLHLVVAGRRRVRVGLHVARAVLAAAQLPEHLGHVHELGQLLKRDDVRAGFRDEVLDPLQACRPINDPLHVCLLHRPLLLQLLEVRHRGHDLPHLLLVLLLLGLRPRRVLVGNPHAVDGLPDALEEDLLGVALTGHQEPVAGQALCKHVELHDRDLKRRRAS